MKMRREGQPAYGYDLTDLERALVNTGWTFMAESHFSMQQYYPERGTPKQIWFPHESPLSLKWAGDDRVPNWACLVHIHGFSTENPDLRDPHTGQRLHQWKGWMIDDEEYYSIPMEDGGGRSY